MTQPAPDRLIYVVGNSRSGTTMLSRMLGRHPAVHTLAENHFLAEICPVPAIHEPATRSDLLPMARQLIARQRDVHSRYVGGGETGRYDDEAAQLLAELPNPVTPYQLFSTHLRREAKLNGKLIPVAQTPRNLFFLPELLAHEPAARVLILVRDGRDIILSQKYKWRAIRAESNEMARASWRFWANYHPITMSLMWKRAVKAGAAMAGRPQIMGLRFEDFVAQPAAHLDNICDFLGLAFQPQMLLVEANDNSSFAAAQAPAGVNPDAAFRWRRDRADRHDLAICQFLCHRQLQALGYPIATDLKPNPIDFLRTGLSWPIKTALALLLNPRRAVEPVRSLYQRIK